MSAIQLCQCEWCHGWELHEKYDSYEDLARRLLDASGPFDDSNEIHALALEFLSRANAYIKNPVKDDPNSTGEDMTPEEQFSLGARRANAWIQKRAMERGYKLTPIKRFKVEP